MNLTEKIESHIEELILSGFPAENAGQIRVEAQSPIDDVVGKRRNPQPPNGGWGDSAERASNEAPRQRVAAAH